MKIKRARANNRKKCLEIETPKGSMDLPYAKLDLRPTRENKIADIFVDPELGKKAVTYILESGEESSVPLDAFLDYNKDPQYIRDATLYDLTLQAEKRLKASKLSKQEVTRRLGTSPSQLDRLLDTTNYRKSIDEMLKLLFVLGYRVEFKIDRDIA